MEHDIVKLIQDAVGHWRGRIIVCRNCDYEVDTEVAVPMRQEVEDWLRGRCKRTEGRRSTDRCGQTIIGL